MMPSSTNTAILQVAGVTKTYPPDIQALVDVSLDVITGEILCLLGPSGCGKTTLLRIVAGLELPDKGSVAFAGRDMAGVPPHERDFGMMFQDFALFPHKNVYDNVAFGLRMRRLPESAVRQRVTEMLSLVDMSDYAMRDVELLSGGEQQRVALARSLAPDPKLILLDEPLGALDRALRERLMLDVRDILKQVHVTAIYVTHDQTEAFAIGDRVAVMNRGKIEQVAAPQVAYAHPATPFVADFFGFENLMPVSRRSGDIFFTEIGSFKMNFEPDGSGEDVALLLIKPQGATITPLAKPDGNASVPNRFVAVVAALSFRGRYCQVWLESQGLRLLFETTGTLSFDVGEQVEVVVSPEQLIPYGSSTIL